MREAVKYIEEHLATPIDSLGKDVILNCAKTAMSSKIVGADSDFFGKMVGWCNSSAWSISKII
jgi:T-complex protein 1 subunit alpha